MAENRRASLRGLGLLAAVSGAIVFVGGLIFGSAGVAEPDTPVAWGPDLAVTGHTVNTSHSANLDAVVDFLTAGKYLGWPHDPYIRPTGDMHRTPDGTIIDGTTHHRVRVYYSPSVAAWLENGRTGVLPDRSMIVKEMYRSIAPFYPEEDEVIGWAAMVKKTGAAHDGWHWTIYFKPAFRSMETMGTFSYSFCLTCHASTRGENTFADLDNLVGRNAADTTGRPFVDLVDPLFFQNVQDDPGDPHPAPMMALDPAFAALYAAASTYPYTSVPDYAAETAGPSLPSTDFDHVWNPAGLPADAPSYITSDNCIGCHDATFLVETQVPNMLIRRPVFDGAGQQSGNELLNVSVYGEWRSSPMGMAGRDPIFFAQLESELNLHPEHADEIQNTCLSCHGVMGQRQFHLEQDGDENFLLSHVNATEGADARYGALARDGISCAVCHQMSPSTFPDVSGKPLPDSGAFVQGPWNVVHGPTPDDDIGGPIRTLPMRNALGITPAFDPNLKTSELCGTCHTIRLPVLPESDPFRGDSPLHTDGTVLLSEAHEQDTYLEWLYSAYQNSNPSIPVDPQGARTCQDCHMRSDFLGNGVPIDAKLANIQDINWPDPPADNLAPAEAITVPVRAGLKRHTFFGMNLFVLAMYRQFGPLFGLEPDSNPPAGTMDPYDFAILNGEYQIRHETADIALRAVATSAGGELTATARVTNKAGHRLPSGVGFRRAFIEFTVLDAAGKVLWGSGVTDGRGVIVGPDGAPLASEFTGDWQALQPHYAEIGSPAEVQIYEERAINAYADETDPAQGGPELRLTTSFLGIGKVVKDNRLLPRGYRYDVIEDAWQAAPEGSDEREKFESLLPISALPPAAGAVDPRRDPDYVSGSGTDEVVYRVPHSAIPGAANVRARLLYQSIPPYYLRDRFAAGRGPAAQRLYYLVGHLQTGGTAIEGWKIEVASDEAPVPPPPN